ncbi:hypothetical protein CF15_06035 [Pyrodictium occultum]|uniref:B box-type domain-containing protein n=1 Tax=Pyrodictium occultum TaxID=2309 RepID=A0A0V8RW88_PYROC|nr:hypothetical protein [Pyrodictium occultum]KSW12304.1 hypothetical protein CF15_06035 [Pyrodictium occultum]
MRSKRERSSSGSAGTLCEVCGEAPAAHVCPMCGRRVCDEDWAGDRCIVCRETSCSICGARLAVASCSICGRPVCDECSVQVTPVARVCRECLARLGGLPREWPPRSLVLAELRRLSAGLSSLLRG